MMNSKLIMIRPTFTPVASKLNIKQTYLARITAGKTSPPIVRQNSSQSSTPSPSYLLPPTSAYIHLPFCRKRCHYCDFPIVALGTSSPYESNTEDDPRMVNYVNLICREILATGGFNLDTHPPLKTVFFGGGTPSLVPPRLVSKVIDTLSSKFGVSHDAEISMEMDPGTFDGEKLKRLIGLGVNRVSLGVQAFQDELLKSCGRAHGIGEVFEAIETLKSCGVENWSADLISSLPHQTREMWDESLRFTVSAQPTHVSVYDLQVEEGTKFGKLYTPGEFPLPTDNQAAEFYRMASKTLRESGYNHYEISSYGKSGFECKHNQVYWENKSFYGFGLGSASYTSGVRFSRPKSMKEYSNFVYDLEHGCIKQDENDQADNFMDRATDVVMLSLRTARGLDVKFFGQVFGSSTIASVYTVMKPYIESGHVLCLDEQRNHMGADELKFLVADEGRELEDVLGYIRLSDPDGFLLSNELISVIFAVLAP